MLLAKLSGQLRSSISLVDYYPLLFTLLDIYIHVKDGDINILSPLFLFLIVALLVD